MVLSVPCQHLGGNPVPEVFKMTILFYKRSFQGARGLAPETIQSPPSPFAFSKPPLFISEACRYLALCSQSPRTFEVERPEFTKNSCLGHFLKYKSLEDMSYPNRKKKLLYPPTQITLAYFINYFFLT